MLFGCSYSLGVREIEKVFVRESGSVWRRERESESKLGMQPCPLFPDLVHMAQSVKGALFSGSIGGFGPV